MPIGVSPDRGGGVTAEQPLGDFTATRRMVILSAHGRDRRRQRLLALVLCADRLLHEPLLLRPAQHVTPSRPPTTTSGRVRDPRARWSAR